MKKLELLLLLEVDRQVEDESSLISAIFQASMPFLWSPSRPFYLDRGRLGLSTSTDPLFSTTHVRCFMPLGAGAMAPR
jgi:hypothetical protein